MNPCRNEHKPNPRPPPPHAREPLAPFYDVKTRKQVGLLPYFHATLRVQMPPNAKKEESRTRHASIPAKHEHMLH